MQALMFRSVPKTAVLVLTILVALAIGQYACAEEVAIVVSPSTINLESHGEWVTVHADIAYNAVDKATLTLDGIEVAWTKMDDCGDLVGKFAVDDVKSILEEGTVTLTLAGVTVDGEAFSGTDVVKVIRVSGK